MKRRKPGSDSRTRSDTSGIAARVLRFDAGRLDRPSIGNCIGIGLSPSFIEPFDSTGLHFADFASKMLAEHVPSTGPNDALSRRFNKIMNEAYDEALDSVALHYVLGRRRDTPFWRKETAAARQPERLRDQLLIWHSRPASKYDFTSSMQLFSHQNYD